MTHKKPLLFRLKGQLSQTEDTLKLCKVVKGTFEISWSFKNLLSRIAITSYIILVNMISVSYVSLSHLACQDRTLPVSNLCYTVLFAYRFSLEQEPTQSEPRSEGRTGDFNGSGRR